jgi:hypothetical protein
MLVAATLPAQAAMRPVWRVRATFAVTGASEDLLGIAATIGSCVAVR